MAIELATAYVNLQASARGIGQSISREIGAPLAAAGVAGGKTLGDNVGKGFNAQKVGAGAGKALAVGVGIGVAGGLAAVKIGDTFDKAFDQIRVGTGATGEALEGLKADFKEVFKDVPVDAGTVSTAIADLNTRLGISGEPLQALSTQFIELSRLTGTDLAGNIAGLTRVFGDWAIPVEDSSEALDKVFRASQASGIGLDQLQQKVVQFGAPLRNLGFGFDESLALLSQFDKAGVNTETVFAGLRAGIGKLAKAGEEVPDTFRRVVSEIQAVGPGTEATAKAIELFGQRAGPDLADAIAGGKFEIDELLGAITDGGDTILSAAADTESFGEKWQKLVNRTLVALEPAATKVFEAVGKAVEGLTPFIEKAAVKFGELVDFFERNKGLAKALAAGIGVLAAGLAALFVIGKVVTIFATFAKVLGTLSTVFKVVTGAVKLFNLALLANPIGLIIAAVVAVGVALFAAYKRFEGFRKVVDAVGRFIKGVFLGALNAVKSWWDRNGQKIIAAAQAVWDGIKSGVEAVASVIGDVIDAVVGFITGTLIPAFQQAAEVVGAVFGAIGDVIAFVWTSVVEPIFNLYVSFIRNVLLPILGTLGRVFGAAFRAAGAVVSAVWGGVIRPVFDAVGSVISNVLLPAFRVISSVVSTVFRAVGAAISRAWNSVVKPVFEALGRFITQTLAPTLGRFVEVVRAGWRAISDAVSRAWDGVRAVFDALRAGLQAVADFVRARVDDVVGFFAGLATRVKAGFSTLADIVTAPFKTAFNAIARLWNSTVGQLSFTVPDWVPLIGGRGWTAPKLPTFHTGGIIPGRKGEEVMILGLAGERVLSPAETASYDERPDRGQTVSIDATYNMVEREPRPEELVRAFRRASLGVI
jgi:TP901 family phage tail tape measure protein